MPSLQEPSPKDLDQTADQLEGLMRKRLDLEEQLRSLKRHLVEMRVALSELEELREEHTRGNITEDAYFVRRKKLKTDYMLARESISENTISYLLNQVTEPNEKSRLQRLKDAVSSNKEFVLLILDVVSTILKKVSGSS
jgi:hypothetical protein